MADFQVIAPLASKILDATNAWSGVAGKLSGLVMAPILVGVTLTIMWHGFNILRGAGGQHAILDVFAKFIRAFLVVGLAISAGAYSENIVGFFQELRSGLTSMFVSGNATSYQALDTAVSAALSSWDPTWAWASEHISLISTSPDTSGIVALGCWFFMVGSMLIFATLCAINLIVIDFALALIFALGPIFVACFAFQSTARFTDAWMGGVLKYTFTAVVISAVVGIGMGILQTFTGALAASAGALDFVTAAFAAVGASVILCVLTSRIPNIAGDIVGGIGISAFGPSMASAPWSAAKSLASGAVGGVAKAGAFGAGRMSGSAAGEALGNAGRAIAGTNLGAKVAGAARTTSGLAEAMSGQGLKNAFSLGRGGTGSITGGDPVASARPVEKQHVPSHPVMAYRAKTRAR